MTFPAPRPGLVIRYSFLWSNEADGGAVEASKDRPCAIVVALRRAEDGAHQTIVAPVTHSPPMDPSTSLEIPASVCRALGLDDGRHWLRLDELNRFLWPGYDLPPRPGSAGRFDYGMLPQDLFEKLKSGIIALQRQRKARVTSRD
jgi:hypothetical protein